MNIQKNPFIYKTAGQSVISKGNINKNPSVTTDNTSSVEYSSNATDAIKNNALSNISFRSNDYIIRQKQKELMELFKIKDASEGYYPKVEDVRISTFAKNFKDKIIFDNYALNGHLLHKKNEILEVLEDAKYLSIREIEDDAKKIHHPAAATQLYFGEIIRKEFLENLYQAVSNDPSNEYIDMKYHIYTVSKDLQKKHSADFLDEQAKTKLESKNDNEINIKKTELSKEDIDLLKSCIDHHEVAKDNYDLKELSDMIISEYVGGNYNMKRLPTHIQTACLQTQKRYNSEEKRFHPTKREPVYRWLCINDVPNFIKNFPEVGQEYSYPQMQSCSKYKDYAENEFRDDSPDMLVKFVYHPIGETSQAYDIGDRKYGGNEVIYPANTKFKVIGKEFVEAAKRDEKYGTASPTFYRYVIHLQEVAPEK